jgi:PKD domain
MGFRKSISISIGLVVLTFFGGSADAQPSAGKTMQFTSTNTTSFGSAPFNFDGAGVANYAFFAGTSDLGKVTGQGISQSAPTGNTCTLPDGSSGIELKLVDHVAVTRFESTGDLLYERGQPGDLTACLNLQTGTFHEGGSVHIIGGTGGFKGATGSYVASQEGTILVPPGSKQLQFGFALATYKYTITIPTTPQSTTTAIASPKNATVVSRSIQLDGSQSTSADGKPLTYIWTTPQGSPSAAILGGTTATPTVQFTQSHVTYTFQLTVTDSAGKSATDFVKVDYEGF